MVVNDPHNLSRFIEAQANVYAQVQKELAAGRKKTHWMWFIYPQLDGLGSSAISKQFAIKSMAEARAYSHHPLLGKRLRDSTECVVGLEYKPIEEIFGFPDDRKFHSSMTLFSLVEPDDQLFATAITRYFDSKMDSKTLGLWARLAD